MKYQSTKTFGNDRGLSCAFRQPNATHSHCSLIHGYSLGFKFVFEADTLDDKNWVYDFGNTKWMKAFLEENFDHTIAVDKQDPNLDDFKELEKLGIAKIVEMDGVGCEKFAEHVFRHVAKKVAMESMYRVRLVSVEAFEHGANSAICIGDPDEFRQA
jgi:6-pyruvoyltetrahydropterin/6-carboxytetrahydropterin synthase